MSKFFLGIDPGMTGGIAEIHESGDKIELTPMPETDRDIWNFFNKLGVDVFAALEKVHTMPRQGIVSAFKFGSGVGGLRMALCAAGIPYEEISPQMWMQGLGIRKRDNIESKRDYKKRLLVKAQQLFPKVVCINLFVADALLLAEFVRRKHLGIIKDEEDEE